MQWIFQRRLATVLSFYYGAQFTTTSSLNKPIFLVVLDMHAFVFSQFGFPVGEKRAVVYVKQGGAAGEEGEIGFVAALPFQRYTSRRWSTR